MGKGRLKTDLEDITTFLNRLDPSLDSKASLNSNASVDRNASLDSNLSDLYLFGHLVLEERVNHDIALSSGKSRG
jgi:hypothetical protein